MASSLVFSLENQCGDTQVRPTCTIIISMSKDGSYYGRRFILVFMNLGSNHSVNVKCLSALKKRYTNPMYYYYFY